MNLHTCCQHCKKTRYVMDCKRHHDVYSANVVCDLCNGESAFIICFEDTFARPMLVAAIALKKDEYLCPECFGVFEKGRTDQEALESARKRLNNPDLQFSETELVCEDCFNEIVIPQLN